MSYGRGEAKVIVTPGGVLAGGLTFEEVEEDGSTKYAVKYPNAKEIRLEPFLKVGEHVMYQPLSPCPWTLPPPAKPYGSTGDLWKAVKEYVYDHIDFPYDSQYDVYTAWVIADWTLERWDSVSYLWFTGPRNSGKTRALDVLAQLAYRPLLSPSVSASSIYRALDAFHPTFLLDEFEMYAKMKETKAEVIGILNAGYRRGQVVLRTDKVQDGAPVLRGFSCFGFKALSSIEELPHALQGRTITFIMSKAVRKVKRLLDKERARELRGMLLQYRFDHLADPPPSDNPIDIPDGRLIELYTPLVTVAPPEVHDVLFSYARGEYEAAIIADLETDEAKVFTTIMDMLRKELRLRIPQADIRARINEDLPEKEQWKTQKTGLRIKKIGLKSEPGEGRRLEVLVDPQVLGRVAGRYTMLKERGTVEDVVQRLQGLQGKPVALFEAFEAAAPAEKREIEILERNLCEKCGSALGRDCYIPNKGRRWLCEQCLREETA